LRGGGLTVRQASSWRFKKEEGTGEGLEDIEKQLERREGNTVTRINLPKGKKGYAERNRLKEKLVDGKRKKSRKLPGNKHPSNPNVHRKNMALKRRIQSVL